MLMCRTARLSVCLIALLTAIDADKSRSAEPKEKSYFVIGNSLTWDTVPGLLSGDVQWHVDCGKSLPFLQANPGKPCVKTSTLWPAAFKGKQYDVISVQPHYGSTLTQDVETISVWMKMQPEAVFVIHSGWAHHATREEEFANPDPTEKMQYSPAYYRALVAELRRLHPGRTVRQTRAIHLLAQIAGDIAAKKAPFDDITELHRDVIHMKHESGKYLMHNAMRHALGQPLSAAGFKTMDMNVRQYLDSVLALLRVQPADKKLLNQILPIAEDVDRPSLVAQIADENLRSRTSDTLPEIENGRPVCDDAHWPCRRRLRTSVERSILRRVGLNGCTWLQAIRRRISLRRRSRSIFTTATTHSRVVAERMSESPTHGLSDCPG